MGMGRRIRAAQGRPASRPDDRAPPASSVAVRHVMQSNRARDTRPERLLRRALCNAGLSGYRLNYREAPGRPDIAYTRARVAIFVHGCFWHHCPKCSRSLPQSNREFWRAKFRANRRRDRRKRAELERLGWRVLEVWECDVEEQPDSCVMRVGRLLAPIGSPRIVRRPPYRTPARA